MTPISKKWLFPWGWIGDLSHQKGSIVINLPPVAGKWDTRCERPDYTEFSPKLPFPSDAEVMLGLFSSPLGVSHNASLSGTVASHLVFIKSTNNPTANSQNKRSWLFKGILIYLFIERGEGRQKERERNIHLLPLPPAPISTSPQPRHEPWPGIQLVGNPLLCVMTLNQLSHEV